MNIDLIIVVVGMVMVLASGRYLNWNKSNFFPIFVCHCLGMLLVWGEVFASIFKHR